MNKQIEEMVKAINKSEILCRTCGENTYSYCADAIAELLYNAGYRKASQEGAECPTCHGTGRIGTTDWLTKNISKEQLAKEKAEAIAEHEAQLKRDVAKQFKEIAKQYLLGKGLYLAVFKNALNHAEAELKKKYESEGAE
jgi:ribosomal protein L37E